jgi:hypothetical protein
MLEQLKTTITNIYMTVPVAERANFTVTLINHLQNIDKQFYETFNEFEEKYDQHLNKKDK